MEIKTGRYKDWATTQPSHEAGPVSPIWWVSSIGLLYRVVEDLGLSARAWDRIRRVARTLADLEESGGIDESHIGEAVQYRWLDAH